MSLRAGVGLSFLADPLKAALEASDMAMGDAGLARADAALFFTTYTHASSLQDISKQISKVTAAKEVAGCTGFGVLAGSQEVEQAAGLSVLVLSSDQLRSKAFFFKPPAQGGPLSAKRIMRDFMPSGGPAQAGFLFPDITQADPDALLGALDESNPAAVWVGGCPAGNSSKEPTYQAANGEAGTRGISGLCLSGDFRPVVGVGQGCIPIGKNYIITEAEDNVIIKLDGKPAYDRIVELAKSTKLPQPQDPHAWIFLAFAADVNSKTFPKDGYYVRNILGVDPSKGIIAVAAHVQKGQKVCFALRDPGMAKNDLKSVLQGLKKDLPGPIRFGLYFNCCARGRSLYQSSGVDTALIEKELGKFPLAGFFTYGEIGPVLGRSIMHNYSGILFLACDGRPGTR